MKFREIRCLLGFHDLAYNPFDPPWWLRCKYCNHPDIPPIAHGKHRGIKRK